MNVEELFEMSNIRKSESGLPVNIFVSSGGSVNQQHGPRVKVMIDSSDRFDVNRTVPVILKKNISDDDVVGYQPLPSSIMKPLRRYLNANYDTLIAYWNDEISTGEMIRQLKRLK